VSVHRLASLRSRCDHHPGHVETERSADDNAAHRQNRQLKDDPSDQGEAANAAPKQVQPVVGKLRLVGMRPPFRRQALSGALSA
jgi:hypothetical protein